MTKNIHNIGRKWKKDAEKILESPLNSMILRTYLW